MIQKRITKLIGGGSMWWYALDGDGKIIDASHEDDREGMARLRALVA